MSFLFESVTRETTMICVVLRHVQHNTNHHIFKSNVFSFYLKTNCVEKT